MIGKLSQQSGSGGALVRHRLLIEPFGDPQGAPTPVVPSDQPWILATGGQIADPKAPGDPAHELRLTVEVAIAADVALYQVAAARFETDRD
jgi:hypothetical protein